MIRRDFTKQTLLGALGLSISIGGCKPSSKQTNSAKELVPPFFKLSLAQWSHHKAFKSNELDVFQFPKYAKDLGFTGVEYVSQLYTSWLESQQNYDDGLKMMTEKLLSNASSTGIENLLIMIDGEGDLGIQNEKERLEGVENHFKWIDMANNLGCHSIRVNLFGDGTRDEQVMAASDSMRRLGQYAADKNVNILVENHGGFSSDPEWVVEVIKEAEVSNVGTLPDFGNFCIAREGGERWGAKCINEYPDYYKAVEMMMPYAKAVSAKSYAFDAEGNETKIDYYKMLKVIKEAGYKGYIGVEYEGDAPEKEGIMATKNLLIKAANEI